MSPSFERGLGPRHVFPAPGRRPRGGPLRRRGASEPSDPGRAWPVSWRRQAAWPGSAGAGPPSARRKPQQAWGDRAAPRGHRWTGSPIHPSPGAGHQPWAASGGALLGHRGHRGRLELDAAAGNWVLPHGNQLGRSRGPKPLGCGRLGGFRAGAPHWPGERTRRV